MWNSAYFLKLRTKSPKAVYLAFGQCMYRFLVKQAQRDKDLSLRICCAKKGIIQFCGKDTLTVKEGLGGFTLVRICCLKCFLLDGSYFCTFIM